MFAIAFIWIRLERNERKKIVRALAMNKTSRRHFTLRFTVRFCLLYFSFWCCVIENRFSFNLVSLLFYRYQRWLLFFTCAPSLPSFWFFFSKFTSELEKKCAATLMFSNDDAKVIQHRFHGFAHIMENKEEAKKLHARFHWHCNIRYVAVDIYDHFYV